MQHQPKEEFTRLVRKHHKKTFIKEFDKRIKRVGNDNKGGAKNLVTLLKDYEDQYTDE